MPFNPDIFQDLDEQRVVASGSLRLLEEIRIPPFREAVRSFFGACARASTFLFLHRRY